MSLNMQAEQLLTMIYNNPDVGAKLSLGVGCERVAYKLNDELVVKIEKDTMYNKEAFERLIGSQEVYNYSKELWDSTPEGQTRTEVSIYENATEAEKKLLNPLLAHGKFKNGNYTVSPTVRTGKALDYDSLYLLCDVNEHNFDFKVLSEFCNRFELDYDDIVDNKGNFGLNLKGEPVVIDFGLASWE